MKIETYENKFPAMMKNNNALYAILHKKHTFDHLSNVIALSFA